MRQPGFGFIALASGLLAFALAHTAVAQRSPENTGKRGMAEYQKYCAACHGVNGDGDGLVAGALKVAPTDLTRLQERHGRPLPRQKLMEFIDGRRPLIAHGSREMPVWGERLWENLPSRTPEMRIRGSILVILDYLESIQVDTGTTPD